MEKAKATNKKNNSIKTFVDWAGSCKSLLADENDTPIKNCELIDIKIKRRDEDTVFLTDEEVYQRVRRGNCVITYNENGEKQYKIARKGLKKFFDYKIQYKNKGDDKKIKKKVLDSVKQEFQEGRKIFVYLTEKANGENLQIAYELYLKGWIIGSKNVTIFCRDREDIDWYRLKSQTAQKYSFCMEFADLWFDILDKRIISKGVYDDFIKDITGYTLIGENVGDINHQHIKLYPEKDIIFYAMVQNDSDIDCLPIKQSCEILGTKYGLSYVKYEVSQIFENFDELKDYMAKKYQEILYKKVEEGGEGSVAYFTSVDSEGKETIVSLGKLKTFEYRFLRKVREKLKTFAKSGQNYKQILKKIQSESEDLLGEEGDEIELEEYMRFAEFILSFIDKTGVKVNFTDHYASFIYDMKILYQKHLQGQVVNYDTYNRLGKKYDQDSEEKINIDLNVKLTDELIETDDKSNKKSDKKDKKKGKKEKNNKHSDEQVIKENKQIIKNKRKIYFILCIGLVAGGKSTLLTSFENAIYSNYSNKLNFMSISSDAFRRSLIDKYREKNPNKTVYEAFSKVDFEYKASFNKEIIKTVNEEYDENKINIMFVDKNFNLKTAQGFYTELYNSKDLNAEYEVIIFHPEIINTMDERFPFSWSYFIQSYYRLKNRKEHETLDYEIHPYPHYILLSFLSLFDEPTFKIKNNKLVNYAITFAVEKDLKIPSDIAKSFKTIMKKIGKKAFDIDHINQFDDLISNFFFRIEEEFPFESFEDTRDIMTEEVDKFIKYKFNI